MSKNSQEKKDAAMMEVASPRKIDKKLADRIKVLETKNVEIRKELDGLKDSVKKLLSLPLVKEGAE